MITILIEIGQVTPPVGLNLSVLTAITNGEISSVERLSRRFLIGLF